MYYRQREASAGRLCSDHASAAEAFCLAFNRSTVWFVQHHLWLALAAYFLPGKKAVLQEKVSRTDDHQHCLHCLTVRIGINGYQAGERGHEQTQLRIYILL